MSAGHPRIADKVALVDFDGTMFPFGDLDGDLPPLPGTVTAMHLLKDRGYRVVIFTSRLSETWWESEGMHPREAYREQVSYIARQCRKYGIPFDDMTAEKIPAEVYFDDKARRVLPNDGWDLLSAVRTHLHAVDTEALLGA